MIALVDTIFDPILGWIDKVIEILQMAIVPVARPFDPSDYLGIYGQIGQGWIGFITSGLVMCFIYVVIYIVMAKSGVYLKFKKSVKWW